MLLLFLLNSVATFPVLLTCQPVSYLTGWHVGELLTIGFLEDCTGACLHKLKTTLCLHEWVCIGKYLHKHAQPQYHKASISYQTANCTLSNLWEYLAGHLNCFSWDVNSCINFENHSRNNSVQFLLLCKSKVLLNGAWLPGWSADSSTQLWVYWCEIDNW